MLTKEIETWRGFMDKLPMDKDKAYIDDFIDTRLLVTGNITDVCKSPTY
jgi:hypothetical protein